MSTKGSKWRSFVKSAVEEYEVEEPTVVLTLEYWSADTEKCLKLLDNLLAANKVTYSIKSNGKTSIHQIGYISKYKITCSETSKDVVFSCIKDAANVG